MKNQEKGIIVKAINEYLALMPSAAHYNICRQQETKKILLFLLSQKEPSIVAFFSVNTLQEFLSDIQKWDGVTHEPEDVTLQLLLLDVQAELKIVRNKMLGYPATSYSRGS
jgi:hypothetical protein